MKRCKKCKTNLRNDIYGRFCEDCYVEVVVLNGITPHERTQYLALQRKGGFEKDKQYAAKDKFQSLFK